MTSGCSWKNFKNSASSFLSEHHNSSSSPCSPNRAAIATYWVSKDFRLYLSPYGEVKVTSHLQWLTISKKSLTSLIFVKRIYIKPHSLKINKTVKLRRSTIELFCHMVAEEGIEPPLTANTKQKELLLLSFGIPWETWTPDLAVRSRTLYPTKLKGHIQGAEGHYTPWYPTLSSVNHVRTA